MGEAHHASSSCPGHFALDVAPEFTRLALSDYAEQAPSVLVYAGAAVLLLRIGDRLRAGHDYFRIHAECQGVRPRTRTAGAGGTGRGLARRAQRQRIATLR